MPEENPHLVESEHARASGDPDTIRRLYHNYGQQLLADYGERIGDVAQHGSEAVAKWQQLTLEAHVKGKRVLDVGCGPKPAVSFRLARDAKGVVCSDLSHGLVLLARELALREGTANTYFIVADAERLPFAANAFDVVTADDVIEHVPLPEHLVAECARVVRPEGIVSISTPNRRAISVYFDKLRDMMRGQLGPAEKYFLVPSHLREYTRAELRDLSSIFFAGVKFGAVGWDGHDKFKKVVSAVTTKFPFRGLTRHWVVQLRGTRI